MAELTPEATLRRLVALQYAATLRALDPGNRWLRWFDRKERHG